MAAEIVAHNVRSIAAHERELALQERLSQEPPAGWAADSDARPDRETGPYPAVLLPLNLLGAWVAIGCLRNPWQKESSNEEGNQTWMITVSSLLRV